MSNLFKMYGFYDERNVLIAQVPSTDIEEAKKYFESNYPDKKYMHIEVLF